VIACEFYTLDDARRRFPQRLSIRLQESANGDAEEAVGQLKHAIQKFPGDLPLRFHVCTPDGDTVHLSAKKIRVRPAPELLSELRKRFGKDNVWLET
jgi:hypothetical protein